MEIAGSCMIGQLSAGKRLAEAMHLVGELPRLLDELAAGRVFVPQARVIVEETAALKPEVCSEVESRVLTDARQLAPGHLRKHVRAVILAVDAAEAAKREAEAERGRSLTIRPIEDGQSLLIARGPALALRQLDQRLRAEARALIAAGDARTIDQLRFDLLCTHNAAGAAVTKQLTAVIQVPVATALGIADEPGCLEGYGPLSAAKTRELLTSAALLKACVDEGTGRVLGSEAHVIKPANSPEVLRRRLLQMLRTPTFVDHSPEPQHDPSAGLVRELRLRDAGCDGPGCSAPTHTVHTRDRPPPFVPVDAQLPTPADLAARDATLRAEL
ncbi:MAG: DUF222 domain-containing protein, partial [Mycobacteriales bacterium]